VSQGAVKGQKQEEVNSSENMGASRGRKPQLYPFLIFLEKNQTEQRNISNIIIPKINKILLFFFSLTNIPGSVSQLFYNVTHLKNLLKYPEIVKHSFFYRCNSPV
jgi:hypothetical protein